MKAKAQHRLGWSWGVCRQTLVVTTFKVQLKLLYKGWGWEWAPGQLWGASIIYPYWSQLICVACGGVWPPLPRLYAPTLSCKKNVFFQIMTQWHACQSIRGGSSSVPLVPYAPLVRLVVALRKAQIKGYKEGPLLHIFGQEVVVYVLWVLWEPWRVLMCVWIWWVHTDVHHIRTCVYVCASV